MHNQSEYNKEYYKKNREKIRAWYKKYREENKEVINERGRDYIRRNRDKYLKSRKSQYLKFRENRNAWNKKRHAQLKLKVFTHYGLSCACCGESMYEFLNIDHIDGGGREHVKSIGGNLYYWLIKNNYPDGFQTLCYNCNMSKGHYGKCPHQNLK